ncbi:zinc metalloprotease [Actinomadura decatromicini]|uniref:Zinc metalloprotease n=1 Tax=Actinomadura decatromicini TaxID=2604572 RepID=A0A5D3FXK6_9ACTN|nr:zinc metalloprotease [Actinomadura decatromicini]TYK52963.1 zinc metalloprotease [Actinomadura decatromicini]
MGDRTRVRAVPAAARGDGCDRAGTARRARPGDRADLGGEQSAALLGDLRRTLLGRFGTSDEQRLDMALRRARLVVPVRFHVVHSGSRGRVPASVVRRQVSTLNAAYGGRRGGADTGVRFRLASADWTNDSDWFSDPQEYEGSMKKRLRRGGRGTLNVYTAAVGTDVLGFSTFPQWYREHPRLDGVVIDYRALPKNAGGPFDRGYTAVHEIGHWLGLLHTFQGGCVPPGDGVADTPYEADPAEGCPTYRDTCPQRGRDPVHNFMDYGHDTCMREFTAGQGRRIRAAWAAYRSGRRGHRHADPAARRTGRGVDLGTRAPGAARSVGGSR